MHWERIENIVGNRRGVRFPILPCQEQFFGMFNQAPQLITYDELMHETFEDMAHPFHQYFDNTEEVCGADILAYYLPFHGNDEWGIYILDAGVDELAMHLMGIAENQRLDLSRPDAEYLAKHKLLLHELGHHAVEIVHTLIELDPNNPVTGSYRATRLLGRQAQRIHDNEEAVCNWNVKRNKHKFKIRALNYFDPIKDFMLFRQPRGYSRFGEIHKRNFLENVIDTGFTGVLPPATISDLEEEFSRHSKLSRVKPRSAIGWNNPIGFVVPIYLIRTNEHDLRRNN